MSAGLTVAVSGVGSVQPAGRLWEPGEIGLEPVALAYLGGDAGR